MNKHEIVLRSLYKRMQDDLDDSWRMYNDAMEMKACDEVEMARFTIEDAKTRLNHSDIIKEKIDYYMRKNNLMDQSHYKTFYCFVLDKLEELKMKVSKFSV